MKKYVLLLALLAALAAGYAETVDGYVVLHNNDTLYGVLKTRAPLFSKTSKLNTIELTDSAGNVAVYTPKDIKAYGYSDKSGQRIFRSKPTTRDTLLFLELFAGGPNASVYQYDKSVGTGMSSTGVMMSATEIFYTFERKDGAFVFLENFDGLVKIREKLLAFYGSSPQLREFIDHRFTARRHIQKDIKAVVAEVNK